MGGTLTGNPSDPQLVWLVDGRGNRIDISWPPGFAVVFAPDAILFDGRRSVVARAGNLLDVNVDPASHAGTIADPYPANQFNAGDVANEVCYPPPASP